MVTHPVTVISASSGHAQMEEDIGKMRMEVMTP
jgi:hypothetical protein